MRLTGQPDIGIPRGAQFSHGSPMASDTLIGRGFALGALRSAVDSSAAGNGGVVLVSGEAGMGKTALATEAAAYAASRGEDTRWNPRRRREVP